MVPSAPRLSQRLLDELARIDRPSRSYADVCRRLGDRAAELGLPRPSYETVRVLVRRSRALAAAPTTSEVVVDVAFRARPPDAVIDHVSGVGVRPR